MPSELEAFRRLLRERPDIHSILLKGITEGRIKDVSEAPVDEETIIVCGPGHGGVEGSKQARCACGELLWMSPSTQEVLKQRRQAPTRVICMSCFRKEPLKPL